MGLAAARSRSSAIALTRMRIDHVIYGTTDLDRAADRMQAEFGLTAVGGGRHEGLGTHNRIVPLGGGNFVELLAVADPDEAKASPLGAALMTAIQRGDSLLGWAVAVDDVEPVAARLGLPITAVGRQGMKALLVGVAESLAEPYLPFFIQHPTDRPAQRTTDAEPITWIEVAGDVGRLEAWLAGAELPLRVVSGPPGLQAVGIGDHELSSSVGG
jgi:catechol 2,3-dioxygenase-like lactoylglutathione lyase family enzyme